jgi:hypothetical protein
MNPQIRQAVAGRWRRGAALSMLGTLAVALLPAVAIPAAAAGQPDCQARTPGGAVFITPGCVDPALTEPYTDVDEQRSTTDPGPGVTVHYRYIHGGFTGTNARFSLYFPAARAYRGRFFESTYPTLTRRTRHRTRSRSPSPAAPTSCRPTTAVASPLPRCSAATA